MKRLIIFSCIMTFNYIVMAQDKLIIPAKVDFEVYEKLIPEVKQHRQNHLVTLDQFLAMSKENNNVVILDARSERMYKRKHIKGAVNLNFF